MTLLRMFDAVAWIVTARLFFIRRSRESCALRFLLPGPMIKLRGALPNVPAAGIENARVLKKSGQARTSVAAIDDGGALARLKSKVQMAEAEGLAHREIASESVEERLAALERDDEVEKLLNELRAKKKTA